MLPAVSGEVGVEGGAAGDGDSPVGRAADDEVVHYFAGAGRCGVCGDGPLRVTINLQPEDLADVDVAGERAGDGAGEADGLQQQVGARAATCTPPRL